MTVRFIEQRDRAQWQTMWDGYNAFYGRPNFSMDITETTWSRFFDPAEPVTLWWRNKVTNCSD